MAIKFDKPNKVNYFGIEVDPEVTWHGWEPGNKYTKKLTLKNVKFATQKLNFSVPAMEVFTTTFPKTITLSAGTSFFLPITFKPHRKDVFEDKIDFQTSTGEIFSVPVKALLPQFSLQFPDKITCGTVAAHDVAKKEIIVQNISELETPFKWCVESPYSIEPQNGLIAPFASLKCVVFFEPKDVGTYNMVIPLLYGDKLSNQKTLTVTSVAKYPNISLMVENLDQSEILNDDGQIVVDFGLGTVGKCYEKCLKIQNFSEVDASVEILRADKTNPIDWVFFCPLDFSPVPGGTCLNIMLQYRPKLVLTNCVENFLIKISDKCGTFKMKCVGQTDGPQVTVSQQSINFFQLNINETATQPIILTNNSILSTISFQFVTDPDFSVFHLNKCNGVIKSKDSVQIVVTFRPKKPIQYYRRLVCLVPDQEPFFIDLLGTCHDMYSRPQILQMKHLQNFRNRQQEGLSYFAPETLMTYTNKGLLKLDDIGHVKIVDKEQLKSECEIVPVLSKWKEYFFSNHETDVVFFTPYIGQDVHSVYFDGVEFINKSQIQEKVISSHLDSNALSMINKFQKKISLKNNTKGPLIIHWNSCYTSPDTPIFSVHPDVTEMSPGETTVFTVTFCPNGGERIFGAEIEAFAYFKSQRQFELVDEHFISPPFCVLLRCAGHTFCHSGQPFLPRFEFDCSQVVFPSVNTTETAFRNLTLENKGEQPFLFTCDKLESPFSIKPDIGYIMPNEKQIFSIRCEPMEMNQYQTTLKIKLNERTDFLQILPVLGSADNATVVLENNSQMYFGNTNVGNISIQRYSIKNASRIPLKYTWKIRPDDSFIIRVYPETGMLLPNEIKTQQWVFSPSRNGRIVVKTLIMVQGISPFGSLTEPKYYSLRIIGQGDEAYLEANEPKLLKFDPQVVGSSAYKSFELMNSFESTVYYKLFLSNDENDENSKPDEAKCITIQDSNGFLPGRCKRTIYVNVRPRKRKTYKFHIGYCLMDNNHQELEIFNKEKCETSSSSERKCLNVSSDCLVSVEITGVFPTVRVTDVQASGSTKWISKLNLWKNLSLDNFNVCLDSDPTTSELIYNVATRASFHRQAPMTTRAIIDMNLGAAPMNSETSEVRLLFENCGSVNAEFAFFFPQQLEMELEYWAETGEYTEEELHQMKVQDNRLFDIQPRSALVLPGESVSICISYNHAVVGTDRIPILMKLDQGREILINLIGVTLHYERCYIHFPCKKHVFNPTPIGLTRTPLQYYELHNAGAVPVHYELDLQPLQRLMEDNYNMPVLQCLNPVGDVLPGQTNRLEWIFTPVEAKTYVVEIPFHLSSGDCPKITFTAIGYDQRELGDSFDPNACYPGQCGVPSVQSILLPNQLARLNVERLLIGTVPIFSTIRRIVFLNNITNNRNVTFCWNVTNSFDADFIYIHPQSGRLLSKESVTCHVIFQTRNIPRFFDLNLICEIFEEDQLIKYKNDLHEWENESKRQNEEFTITDSKRKFTEKKPVDNGEKDSGSRKSSSASYLPPVITSPMKGRSLSSQKFAAQEMKNNDIWFKPKMPQPFFLRLGISGRSCPIEEFQRDNSDKVDKQAYNKPEMLGNLASLSIFESECNRVQFPVLTQNKEKSILELVLSELVGGVLDDADFIDAIKCLSNEVIPVFSQIMEDENIMNKNGECQIVDSNIQRVENNNYLNSDALIECDEEQMTHITTPVNSSAETENIPVQQPERIVGGSMLDERKIMESFSFGTLVEGIIENMLLNIVAEANNKEVDLTSRPRLIALPPRSARRDGDPTTNQKPKS